MPDFIDSPDPLASPPRWCPECGYAMLGLPAAGRCPECGWGYDEQTVVLYGRRLRGAERSARRWTPADRVVGVVLGWVIAFGFLMVAIVTGQWSLLLWWGGFLAFVGFLIWVQAHSREGWRSHQLRLTPAGYAARRGFGPARVWPWRPGIGVGFRFDADLPGLSDPARPAGAVILRRVGWGGASGETVFRFDAEWSDVDRLARRVLAWREGA